MESQSTLKELYPKLVNQEISEQELLWLKAYFNTGDPQEMYELIRAELALDEEEHHPTMGERKILDRVHSYITAENFGQDYQHPKEISTVRLWPRISIAAAIAMVIISAGVWFYSKNQNNTLQHDSQYANDIAPGKNGATLTLADGRKISISDVATGDIANEAGVKILKTADGQITYEIVDGNSATTAYNTLTTTRGEQSQVRLPDGTLVFLNAGSSLRYPASFARLDKRIVTLTGEGYFEVAKDRTHPFVVKTNKQSLEVLGTHFNVDSYEDKLTTTTLIEGSVKVSTLNGNSRTLKPNEQAVLSNKGIEVSKVEAEYAIAWKEGFFMFNNESLGSAMEKIARWYNVEVVFEEETLRKKVFIGAISRFEHISEVLKMLEKTKVANFTMDKNKLIIKRKIK